MTDVSDPIAPVVPANENAARVVWALAWPAVALNSLQVVNSLLDRGFIGHLTEAALTAHGCAMNVMFLMFSLAMALATGATALVARAFGAGDAGEYRMAARQALRIAIIGGFLVAAITAISARTVAHALIPADDEAAMIEMARFVLAYAVGLPAIWVVQILAGSLRGIGDTKSPMVISGVQILMHILLNFVLIFPTRQFAGITIPGAHLGLVGAGLALSSSAWLASIAYILYAVKTPLGALFSFALPDWGWVVRILRVAIPAATMALLRVFSLTAFTLVLKVIPNGSIAIGSMSSGFAIESVMFMPAFGLSMAAGALVGQSLGMKKPERAERLAWTAAHHGALVTLCLCIPIYFGAQFIAQTLLGDKVQMIAQAVLLLRYLCVTEVFFAYAMVMLGAMQGAGDTKAPMWITAICLWGVRVPFAIIFALPTGFKLAGAIALPIGLGMGASGAWIAMSLTQAMQGVMAVLLFRRGGWKHKKV